MIRLGNVRHSLPSIARRAFTALHDCGRIAVYVGITGESVAIGYSEPGYRWQLARQQRYLVGVYDDDLRRNEGFKTQLLSDIRDRAKELRGRAA